MQLELKDCSVYYETVGEGHPVLHLHGFPLDHVVLKNTMEPVYAGTSGFRRIYFNLPGMGQSTAHRQFTRAEEMSAVVEAVVDALIGTQPFAVVGESYGGYLMRNVIAQHVQQISGALFLCPVIFADHAKRTLPKRHVVHEEPSLADLLTADEFASFMEAAVVATAENWRRFRDEVKPSLDRGNSPFLLEYASKGYSFEVDPLLGLEPMNIPTLIITGRHDNIVGYQDQYALLEQFNEATLCVLGQAGHNLEIEQAEMVHLMVNDWLSRVGRSGEERERQA